jgi:thiamine pyrophosphate-dependent acetolactate synthase large subunit-like protein
MTEQGNGVAAVAQTLLACGVRDFFYLIGGPMSGTMGACIEAGLHGIDVRDERAASYAAIGYSRVTGRPGVVLSAAGPGTANTITGVAHAQADGAPIVVIGGSSPIYQRDLGVFQEADQVALMKPITKWAYQVQHPDRIADAIQRALQIVQSGAPGPAYVDLPGDILYGDTNVHCPPEGVLRNARTAGDPRYISNAIDVLEHAERPIIVAGSGVYWSRAWNELRAFAETSGVPVFTTPMARGLLPEDHPLCPASARSVAFREADCVLVIGTRMNYVVNWLKPPVMADKARVIAVNLDPAELAHHRSVDVAVLADARLGLQQLSAAIAQRPGWPKFAAWTDHLTEMHTSARRKVVEAAATHDGPIHPLRLCLALERVLPRSAILVADGHEILGFSRRSIPAYEPGHSISPGMWGTMGVGVPFGVGAQVGQPATPVVVLTGDGAFGYHAAELDTAARHGLGITFIVANNGGWTGIRGRPGYSLGHHAYERLTEVYGGRGVCISDPDELDEGLRAALAYAATEHQPSVVNVVVSTARAGGRQFLQYRRDQRSEYEAV